jgi:hypothetical protein
LEPIVLYQGTSLALIRVGRNVWLSGVPIIQIFEGLEPKALILGRIGQCDNLRFEVFAPSPPTVLRASDRAAVVSFRGFAGELV